jgi:hypothetical protein
MRHLHSLSRRVSIKQQAAAVLCLFMLFAAARVVQAQSGRRLPKSPPVSVAPVPEAKASPSPSPSKTETPRLTLYVGMSDSNFYMNVPYYIYGAVRDAFIQRLKEASSISVAGGRQMNRGEAVKRAKGEESTYVIFLQLEGDSFDPRDDRSNPDQSKLTIHYTVFTPVTGKVMTDGRVYQRQYRVGRGGVGLPSPNSRNSNYSDYLLKEAARDAADRVLEEFNVYRPSRGPRFF